MDLRQGSKLSLLLQLGIVHGITVENKDRWIFSPPVALIDDPSGENTKIKLTATRAHQTNVGFRVFKYSRIELASLATYLPAAFPAKLPAEVVDTHGAFSFLKRYAGVLFEAEDVENLPVVDNADGTRTIKLVAKPDSLLWLGSCDLVADDLPDISSAITQPYFDWSPT